MAKLQCRLVSPEREVWSGDAEMVIARTTTGELGIMANHTPLLGNLVEGGVVRVHDEDNDFLIAVHGGFISVANNELSILAEEAELGEEVDAGEARSALERVLDSIEVGDGAESEASKHRARLRAAGEEP